MSQPIRTGLIGVGGIGAVHRNCLFRLQEDNLAQFVAVADPGVDRLAAEKSELESKGVRWFTDYRSMLDDAELDAVVIATPISLHEKMAMACLERGLSFKVGQGNVLVLSPPLVIPDADLDHAIDILDAALTAVEPSRALPS